MSVGVLELRSDQERNEGGIVPLRPDYREFNAMRDVLLNRWRNDGNQKAYRELFDSLGKIGRLIAKKFALRSDVSAGVIFDEVCLTTIFDAIEQYDFDRGLPLANFVFCKLDWAVKSFLTNKRKQNRRTASMEDFGFADPEDLFFYCSEASVSRPGDGFEVAFAAADFRRKILAVIKVIVELDLPEKQREIFKLRYLNGALPTEESIASYLGCTKQNVGKVCGKALDLVEKRIRGALNEEGDLRYDAGEYLCRHFFRTLKNRGLDDRKKLAEVGVVFNNDPGVDLSGAGDNTFNVAVFRDLDGVFISGFDFLDKREVSSIFELFEKIDGGGLLVLPQADEENKEGVTPEKIIITAREFGNLKRLKELTGISFDSKTGKWIIEITGTSFNKKWFLGSEKKLLGGYMLLKYCNLLCDQNGIKKFFEMVFGSENMVFIEDPNDGKNAVDSLVRKLHAQF